MAKTKSGKYWIAWANAHAKNSSSVADLADPFKTHAKEFIKALEDAGATVEVTATKRDAKRAYLFHWSWLSRSTVPHAATPAMFITTSMLGWPAWVSAPNAATSS